MNPAGTSAFVIPTADAAERAVLGAILAGGSEVFQRVKAIVSAADFHDQRYAAIFQAAADLAGAHREVDLITVTAQLECSGTLQAAGGVAYVGSLADGLPDPANVEHYARIVLEASHGRQLQRLAMELLGTAGRGDAGELAQRAAETLSRLALSKDREAASSEVFERAVTKEALNVRVRAEARRRIAAETPRRPFDAALLSNIAEEPVQQRVKGLLARNGRMLWSAVRKSGKTTGCLNLIRSLIRGEDFLGRFAVTPIAGCAGLLNFEVARQDIARWAREVGIPGDRLLVVNLRGCANPFAEPDEAARLAELLREHAVEVIVVDPFGRAYTGKSQNDAGEVGAWLSMLDRFVEAAGCSELVLTAHAGWEGERTRGTSALEDWADTVATTVRDNDDDRLRFFRALGRDVEVAEDRLDFDPATRRLTLAGAGNRATARRERRTEELIAGVVEAVTREPGATTRQLDALLREVGLAHQRGDASRGARAAVEAGQIVRLPGPRGSLRHFLKGQEGDRTRLYPTVPAGHTGVVVRPYPTPPIEGGVRSHHSPPLGKSAYPPGTLDSQPEPELPPEDEEVL